MKNPNSNIPKLALIGGMVLALCATLQAYTSQTLTPYVYPLCGTQNGGNAFVGAVVPFGMVQWGPNTTSVGQAGGYSYNDTQIIGFGLDHLFGAGADWGGDFAFMPILGQVNSSPCANGNNGKTVYASSYSHNNEFPRPGYYGVIFNNGISTELTATTHAGFGRFTYPSGNTCTMNVNAGAGWTVNANININPSTHEIWGWTTMEGFCGGPQQVTLYFDAWFDTPFATYGEWNGGSFYPNATSETGYQTGASVSFNLPNGGTVLSRVGVSYVSSDNAKANLNAEIPSSSFTSTGFNNTWTAADSNWENYLNKIQVSGGSAADTQTFYTMLYHCLLAPSVVSDVNNQYMGHDGTVRTVSGHVQYDYFSGWDIYRSEAQMIAMLDPARASDMAASLVQMASDSGQMPRWSTPYGDAGTMVGDPSTAIISDFYAFGAHNFNTSAAEAAMINGATNPNVHDRNNIYERPDLNEYLSLGYLSETGDGTDGCVSEALEYYTDDFALANFALNALNDTSTYNSAMSRAQNWRELYNDGYLKMRQSNGTWSPGFVIDSAGYDNNDAYREGVATQYVWMVPFNYSWLTGLMGGSSAVDSQLDTFFTQLNQGDTPGDQYAYMGNEPSEETPFVYDFIGEPYKCSNVCRQVMTQLYSYNPGGLPGNDDLGQLSSWYVWAALGFYPEIPGDDTLVMNGPLFPQTVLNLNSGTVTINASGAGDNAPYIQSLSVNGQSSSSPWIRFGSIMNGATLAYAMGTSANTSWGSSSASAPPSYTSGGTPAGTHMISNIANWLVVDNGKTSTQGAGVMQWTANGGSQQKWTFTQNSDNSWNIVSQYSGMNMDDPKLSTTEGTQMIQYPSNGGSNQKWWVDQQANGTYKIWNQFSTDALDDDSNNTNGTPLIQWPWYGGNNQLWLLQ